MPEGPEVQLVADYLHLYLQGKALKHIEIVGGKYKNKPPPFFKEFLAQLPLYVEKVSAKGKMIIFSLKQISGEKAIFNIYAGLGMTGTFTFTPSEQEMKHAAFKFNIEGKAPFPTSFVYSDARRFGNVYFSPEDLSQKLAPGILQDSTWENFITRVAAQKSNRDILSLLMDQEKFVSGIGNYLVAEILYAAKISPFRKGNTLSSQDWQNVFVAAKNIATLSYQVSGCQLKDFSSPFASDKNFKHYLQVYQQDLTPKGEKVQADQGSHGRTIWWVPIAQK